MERRPAREVVAVWAARLGPLLALLLIMVSAALYEAWAREPGSRAFLTAGNLTTVLKQASVWGVVAVGMTFVIAAGGIDLSVGAAVALCGCLGCLAMQRVKGGGGSDSAAVAAGVATMVGAGAVCGAVNGALVWFGRVIPFIATLGTLAAYRSIAQAVVDGGNASAPVNSFVEGFGGGSVALWNSLSGKPVPAYYLFLVFLGVAALASVVPRFLVFGVRVRAVGDNERAAAYAGVRTGAVKLWTFVIAGVCAGVAAVIVSARSGTISSGQTGQLYELDAIAAVVIGGTRMQGGTARVWGTVVGVLILAMIGNILLLVLRINPLYQNLAKGAIIIAAVLVQRAAPVVGRGA
jgi:ribose transport system permease protein